MSINELRIRMQTVNASSAGIVPACTIDDFTVGRGASGIEITGATRANNPLATSPFHP